MQQFSIIWEMFASFVVRFHAMSFEMLERRNLKCIKSRACNDTDLADIFLIFLSSNWIKMSINHIKYDCAVGKWDPKSVLMNYLFNKLWHSYAGYELGHLAVIEQRFVALSKCK